MKKTLLFISVISIFIFINKSFAYSSYDQYGYNYTDEQFRRDVKSYLDYQVQKEEDQDLINNLYTRSNNLKTEYDSELLKEKLEKAKEEDKKIDDQLNQLQEIINKQGQILSQQTDNESNEDKNMTQYCISLKKDLVDGVLSGIQKLCSQYGVYLKVEQPKNDNVSISQEEKPHLAMPDILKDTPANTDNTIKPKKENFFIRLFNKIKQWF